MPKPVVRFTKTSFPRAKFSRQVCSFLSISFKFGKLRRQSSGAVDNVDSSISRARFAVTTFLIVTSDPHYEVLMSAVKTDQSEGIPGAGIPEQAVKKMLTGSAALSLPSPFAFFRAFFLNSRFPHYLGAWNRLIIPLEKAFKNVFTPQEIL